MHIAQILNQHKPAFSYEFFPPKDDASADALLQTVKSLSRLGPAYVSVTYGAGGSSRERTRDLVVRIQKETELTVVSHLTCVGATRDEIGSIVQSFVDSGITNIMALRGDPPKGQSSFSAQPGGFAYAAEMVDFIKRSFPQVGIGVAGFPEGHPETNNRLLEMDYLKAKVDAGADYICTQLFFDNRDFYDYQERCELAGITIPMLAGIMPITTLKGMQRMAELSSRSRFPARLLKALDRASDEKHFENVGIHWTTQQVMDLLNNNVAGIHFYTLNRSRATIRVYESLGITPPDAIDLESVVA
jgi:methylenetetrahydrofolate reductase (NADPH)